MKEERPLVVNWKNEIIFSIESNGDIILRGKKIGKDKRLANIFKTYGERMKIVLNNLSPTSKNY